VFFRGLVFLYPEGDTPNTRIFHSVQHERLYRLLRHPMVGSSGFLDSESTSVSESDQVDHKSEYMSRTHASSNTLRGLN